VYIKLVTWNKSIPWCTVRKTSNCYSNSLLRLGSKLVKCPVLRSSDSFFLTRLHNFTLVSLLILPVLNCLNPCFSISFSPRNTKKKGTHLTKETLPVHNKSNIKLNTRIGLSFMYITRKNQRLTSNLSKTWPFRLTHRLCQWRAALTDLTTESGSFWIEAAIVCVISATEWLVSNVATRILISTYKFRTASKTCPPVCNFVSLHPWHPWSSVEPSLRNTGLNNMLRAQAWPLSTKYSKLPVLFSSNPTCRY